ncbi:MAG: acyl-CoA dehydrogenase family protein [Actinobacteria bacterium]|nr:acyl-CoA dehydrogenase family protein [Actinomycetota bacterium]
MPPTLDRSFLDLESTALSELLAAIAEGSSVRERDRIAPFEQIEMVRSARLGALRLAPEDGGAGATVRELYRIVLALAAADANVAHILRSHFAHVEQLLRLQGEERRHLDPVAEGAIIAGAATELGPGAVGGAAPGASLRREGDGFILDGRKYYSTGSLYADLLMITASDEAGELAVVLIPTARDGVVIEDDWDGIGQRLTASGTTALNAVAVAERELVDPVAISRSSPRFGMAQLYLTAVVAGIVRGVVDDAVELIRSREGRPFVHANASPSADPLLQQVVGELASEAFVAEAAILAAADELDAEAAAVVDGEVDPAVAERAALAAAKAKVVVDGIAFRASTRLFDLGGASATRIAANLDRHWRNARTIASHNPVPHKARAIGDRELNGTPLPENWFF